MGQSTDAILTYGIHIEQDSEAHELCDALRGDRYDEGEAAAKETGAEIVSHCSGDYPMYIVAVSALTTWAWRGHPKEINPTTLLVNENEARDKIKAFCAKFGLPFDDAKCQWILASDWN